MSYYNDNQDQNSYRRSDSPPRHHAQHQQQGEGRFQQPPGPPPGHSYRRDDEQQGRRRFDDEETQRPQHSGQQGGYSGGGRDEEYGGRQHGGRFEPPAGPPPGRFGGRGRDDEQRFGSGDGRGGREHAYGGEHGGGGGYQQGRPSRQHDEQEEQEGRFGRQQHEQASFGGGRGGRRQQQHGYEGGGNTYNSSANEESPYPSTHQLQQQYSAHSSSSADAGGSPYPSVSSSSNYSAGGQGQGQGQGYGSQTSNTGSSQYGQHSSSPYPSSQTSHTSQTSYTSQSQSQSSNNSPYPPYLGSSSSTGGKPADYADMPVHQNATQGAEQYSDLSGRRKALFIGINYGSSSHALKGCHNDVANLSRWVSSQGYEQREMKFLMDDGRSAEPSRAGIIEAMKWLVQDAKPNDALFFHYSGHGSQQQTHEKDEADGMAETICPVDYETAGMITDDEMHQILVSGLPKGCRLTAIFDCCHSGSSLDCPYMYSTSGKLKGPDYTTDLKSGAVSAFKAYTSRDLGGLFSSLAVTGKKVFEGQQATEVSRKTRGSEADVISWSGCKDDQTSADASEGGQATGAMSHAFVAALTKAPKQTYNQLLNTIRDELKGKYDQKPQLSCSHELDCDLLAVF